MANVKESIGKAFGFVKDKLAKFKKWLGGLANWKVVWDKITTGILILLMASPILILGYIFLWFIYK